MVGVSTLRGTLHTFRTLDWEQIDTLLEEYQSDIAKITEEYLPIAC